METVAQKTILNEIIERFAEPAKSRFKLYHLAILIYMDHILELVISKYMFFRVKFVEKKTTLTRMKKSQLNLDLLSKEKLQESIVLVKAKARHSFGKFRYFLTEKNFYWITLQY